MRTIIKILGLLIVFSPWFSCIPGNSSKKSKINLSIEDTLFAKFIAKAPTLPLPFEFTPKYYWGKFFKNVPIIDSLSEHLFINDFDNFRTEEIGEYPTKEFKYKINDSVYAVVYRIQNNFDNFDDMVCMSVYNLMKGHKCTGKIILYRNKTAVFQNESFIDSNFNITTINCSIQAGEFAKIHRDTSLLITLKKYQISPEGNLILQKFFYGKTQCYSKNNLEIKRCYIRDSTKIRAFRAWEYDNNLKTRKYFPTEAKMATLHKNWDITINPSHR